MLPPLYAIADADAAEKHGWRLVDVARAFLQGGARLIQLRAKHVGSAALLATSEEVVAEARRYGATIVVNDRADVAVLAGADGVHVGQDDLAPDAVRRAFPRLGVVGLSTHTPAQFASALAQPASYLAVGPVYSTVTKDTGYEAVGLALVGEAWRRALDANPASPRPIVAIGGITLDRAADVLAAGAASVAVISDLLATGDPESRVRAYLERLT